MSETVNSESADTLSGLLHRLKFSAKVFLRADFCGLWAVDTSGEHRVPFHLVTRGEGWLHLANKEPQKLLPGHLVLFPDDKPHVLASSEKPPDPNIVNQGPPQRLEGLVTTLVCGYFAFDQKAALPLLNSLPNIMVLDLGDTASCGAREAVQLWMREAAEQTLGSDIAIDLLAELVFIHVLRTELAAGRLRGIMSALADPKLGPVLAAIHQDPTVDHQITQMAVTANMSESAFSQRFKRTVGMTPGKYVRHWRMHMAQRELLETERSIAEISNSLAYESEVAFRKAFKAFFGEPPAQLRQRKRDSKQ